METFHALQSGQLKGAKRLDLEMGLTQFPTAILELADSLEILNLTNNRLTTLPDEFARLRQLRIAFFSHNHFEEVPTVLSQCPNLSMVGFKSNKITTIAENSLPSSVRWLILTDNHLEQLPASLGQCVRLQKLMLAGNRLRSLPSEMAACQNLELIRLSANQLTALPPWLFSLPRLSWLAYSGNPLSDSASSPPSALAEIDWATLTLEQPLGEGASGVIFKGVWSTTPTQSKVVAIKIFKGNVTSDGLPTDEMQACIAAGSHPNLVHLLGKVTHHPEQKAALVFDFVPPTYTVLGNPPNFETCTRDCYPPGTSFSASAILQIAQGIAAAATHLHARGILHGDLYAHNILANSTGEALLGDFGAASFYPAGDRTADEWLERLEVRAFGCLLEELLNHGSPPDRPADRDLGDRLRQLQHACMNPVLALRPSFATIAMELASLTLV